MIKFIFVSDIADLAGHTEPFQQFINMICTVLPGINSFKNNHNIGVIFTKVSNEHDKNDIIEPLKVVLNSDISINPAGKNVLQYLINNPEFIAILRKPEKAGAVETTTVSKEIVALINNVNSAEDLYKIKIGLSLEAKEFLNLSYKELKLDLTQEFKSVLENIQKIYLEEIGSISQIVENSKLHSETQEQQKGRLNNLNKEIDGILKAAKESNPYEIVACLEKVSNNIKNIVTESKMASNAKFLCFLEAIIPVKYGEMFQSEVKKAVGLIEKNLNQTHHLIEVNLGEITGQEWKQKTEENEKEYQHILDKQSMLIELYNAENAQRVEENITVLEGLKIAASGVGGLITGAVAGVFGAAAMPFVSAYAMAKTFHDDYKTAKKIQKKEKEAKIKEINKQKSSYEEERQINKVQQKLLNEAEQSQKKVKELNEQLAKMDKSVDEAQYNKLKGLLSIEEAYYSNRKQEAIKFEGAVNKKRITQEKISQLKQQIHEEILNNSTNLKKLDTTMLQKEPLLLQKEDEVNQILENHKNINKSINKLVEDFKGAHSELHSWEEIITSYLFPIEPGMQINKWQGDNEQVAIGESSETE